VPFGTQLWSAHAGINLLCSVRITIGEGTGKYIGLQLNSFYMKFVFFIEENGLKNLIGQDKYYFKV
jgi:hypothetical protein